jgi:hypothetical protein
MATSVLLTNESLRKESFKKFKTARSYYKNTSNGLAVNGFYYYGKKIEIRCAGCGLIIFKLNKKDKAEDVHRKYSPDCEFNNRPTAPPITEIEAADDDDDDADVDICVNDNEVVAIVANNNHSDSNRLYPSLYDNDISVGRVDDRDANNIVDNKNTDESNRGDVDNDDKLCKICFENERNTCFFPCRHVSTCAACARRCKLCCICRVKVKERCEVFL